jgi:hypothetical protein
MIIVIEPISSTLWVQEMVVVFGDSKVGVQKAKQLQKGDRWHYSETSAPW